MITWDLKMKTKPNQTNKNKTKQNLLPTKILVVTTIAIPLGLPSGLVSRVASNPAYSLLYHHQRPTEKELA